MSPNNAEKPAQLTAFDERVPGRGIAGYDWSPDGQRLAVSYVTNTEDVVTITLRD
jgi:hypothetical protein